MDVDFRELSDRLEHAYSRRVALRPASLTDAWPLFEATRSHEFNRYLLWPRPDCESETLHRMSLIAREARKGRLCALSAVVRNTGEWIGLFRFLPHATREGVVEMGVWLHTKFWHGRYSLELGRLCVSAAFALSNVKSLLGASAPANRASCELMRMVGMNPLQLVKRPTEMGYEVELQEYVITRADWHSQHRVQFDLFDPRPVERILDHDQLPSTEPTYQPETSTLAQATSLPSLV